ncbi:hypothetical protein [Cecembia lonarensis]|uniref:DUF2281 domain-containing protein n=1 Tax=Cecembia lonarensis (strain CCUG 58316 / KCTC 22772 / LW9) TaxID=1225176 RepID=K1LWQ1_CECL9|nr:hypothetical protein [Cecembia lonarensis]EKB48599.1 hypothetical protein B879_02757 [Cecembia lonarensis LW9]
MTTKQLKERLIKRIENLSPEKLQDLSRFLESLETENNKMKVLTFAGAWTDLDRETFDELTNNLENRRKSKRTRFF